MADNSIVQRVDKSGHFNELRCQSIQKQRKYHNHDRVLISIDFDDFISPFTPQFLFRLLRYIKHSRQCLIAFQKNLEFRQKYSATRRRLCVWKSDETLFIVFDILHQSCTCVSLCYRPFNYFFYYYNKSFELFFFVFYRILQMK